MKPKELAKELVGRYFKNIFNGYNKIQDNFDWDRAKKCALISVNEMILLIYEVLPPKEYYTKLDELEQVIKEIEKL